MRFKEYKGSEAAVRALPPQVDTYLDNSVSKLTAFFAEFPKKAYKAIAAIKNANGNGQVIINGSEGQDTFAQRMLDTINTPAMIVRLEDSKIMYSNDYARSQLGICNLKNHMMEDLYNCKKSYKNTVNTIKAGKAAKDKEADITTPTGKNLKVLSASTFIVYKGHECKITSLVDITAERKYKHLASIDELTQINNRRSIFNFATAEFNRSKRFKRNFSIMMLDLDYFKKINDTYGHTTGDKVLKKAAKCVSEALREEDKIGRIGGEEFAVVLPETNLREAKKIARRINREIRKIKIATSLTEVTFTASIGVTSISPEDNQVEDTMHRADVALYNAKDNGRDSIYAIVDTKDMKK